MNEDLINFLREHSADIINLSFDDISHRDLNYYGKNQKSITLKRISSLVDVIISCIENDDNGEIISYMHAISKQRYQNGYILFEIQTVINYVEENIWKLLQNSNLKHKVEALRLISGYTGIAKHELARDFIKYSSDETS